MTTTHDARLVPAAATAWLASVAAHYGASAALLWALGLLVMVAVLVVARTARLPRTSARARLVMGASAAGLAAIAGLGAALTATHASAQQRVAVDALVAAGNVDAWVRVVDQPRVWRDGQFFVPVEVVAWRGVCAARGPCRDWRESKVRGDVVLNSSPVRGSVLRVTGEWNVDPDGGSDERPVAWEAVLVERAPESAAVEWRQRFGQATEGLAQRNRALVRGMVLGDTSTMQDAQVEDMRVAGLAHLVAVSGAHFAVLTGGALAVARAARAPRAVRALVVATVACGFALLVGPAPSVWRAATTALAIAAALWWGRPARGLAALSCVVVTLIIAEPPLAVSPGFAMSVSAVAAIVVWAPRIAARLSGMLTPSMARLASIPIAAQFAVLPLLVAIGGTVGPYGVIANVAAGPAVLVAMACGAATLVAAPVSIEAATVLARGAELAAGQIDAIARGVSSLPGAKVAWPAGAWGVGMAVLVVALAIAITVFRGRAWAALSAFVAIALGAHLRSDAGPTLDDWSVVACDVGQGDMLLVRAAPDAAVVIDTGPPGGGGDGCLERYGIERVPLLVLTHPHDDHDGAVPAILASATVENAWVPTIARDSHAAQALAASGVSLEVPAAGHASVTGDAVIEVLSTGHLRDASDENDASIVVAATSGDVTMLALGDLESDGQRALGRELGSARTFDVLKAAHHGSANQDAALVQSLAFRVSVISVGGDNRHGHPASEALELYARPDAALLRTDLCGDIEIARRDGVLVWSECPADVAR